MLKEQLRDTEKRLANLLEAIEQGILTSTTKQRLDELEARRDALKASILEEELQRPALSRDQILFWFERFRQGDANSPVYQRQVIDNFVNSVYIFEDRVVLNFNFKENANTVPLRDVLGSSADGNGPPKQSPRPQAPGFVLHGHRRGGPGSSPVLLRKRGASCGRNRRGRAGATV